MTNKGRTRKFAGGLAVAGLGIAVLGGCELGNGSDPNCSDSTGEALQEKLDRIYEQQDYQRAIIDDPENQADLLAAQIALDILNKKEAATLDAADACDVDVSTTPPPTITD